METNVLVDMRSLSFMITDKCNLKCSFCSKNADFANSRFMDPSFIDKTIKDALKWADIKIINLTGGEALLHPKLDDILSIIDSYGLQARINTNGTLFNDKMINMLNKHNAKMFTISLDSSDAKKHDTIRGIDGAFNKTVEGIKRGVKKGYKIFVKATVSDENVDDIYDLMKFVDDLGIYGFSFGRTIPVGRGETYNYATKDFLKKYFDMGRKTSEYALTSKLEFLIDDPLRFKFDCRSKKLLEQNDISELWGGCSAGCNFLYVNMDLDVLSCPVLLEPCGNLKNNTLEEIWKNSNQLMEFRTRIHLKGKCGKCQYKNICGGCRAYALAITNDSLGEDAFCKRI